MSPTTEERTLNSRDTMSSDTKGCKQTQPCCAANVIQTGSRAARIQIGFQQEKPFAWQPNIWTIFPTAISLDDSVTSLSALFKNEILHRALSDNVLRKVMAVKRHVMFFTATVRTASRCWEIIGPRRSGMKFERLADLFNDPYAATLVLRVDIALTLDRRSTMGVAITDLVQTQPSFGESPGRYLRLGDVPNPDNYPNGNTCDFPVRGKRPDVRYIWALVGWIDPKDGCLRLSRVHAYDYDDFCIGDCEEWTPWHQVRFDFNFDWLLPYTAVKRKQETKTQLLGRVQQHIADGSEEPGSGLPFLPPHTLNTYEPKLYGMGLQQWPRRGIDVAVRCVNRLQDVKNISFPRNLRFDIEESDTVESINEVICSEIRRREDQHGIAIDSGQLFERRHNKKWAMELWVLPQRPGPCKLFQYKEGKLSAFLSPSLRVRKKDKRLYMEAHIVPVS